jgi:hypothetical protein
LSKLGVLIADGRLKGTIYLVLFIGKPRDRHYLKSVIAAVTVESDGSSIQDPDATDIGFGSFRMRGVVYYLFLMSYCGTEGLDMANGPGTVCHVLCTSK